MKIACINQVRDECDIIELFVRINSKVVDHFFIIDNNSCDNTRKILENLVQEGYPISIREDRNGSYNQSELINATLQQINRLNLFDWFVFLDADEFIFEQKSVVECNLKFDCVLNMQWRTQIPVTNFDSSNMFSCFKPLQYEKERFKIALPRSLANQKIQMGAHGLSTSFNDQGEVIPTKISSFKIDHFPVRSESQFLLKCISAYHRIRKNSNIPPTHYTPMIEYIRQKNHKLNTKELQHLAMMYNGIDMVLGESQSSDESLKYPDLTEINMASLLDQELSQ